MRPPPGLTRYAVVAPRILARLAAGERIMSWDVHHTALRCLIVLGLATCGHDCVVRPRR